MKPNPYAMAIHQNTILLQAENHRLPVSRASAALEAKSGEKSVPGNKLEVGKKAVGIRKQKKCLVPEKAAATKKPAAEKKPRKETHHRRKDTCGVNLNLFIPQKSNHCVQLIWNKNLIKGSEKHGKEK